MLLKRLRLRQEQREANARIKVLGAITRLHPDYASMLYLSRVTFMSIGRTAHAIDTLQHEGLIVSRRAMREPDTYVRVYAIVAALRVSP